MKREIILDVDTGTDDAIAVMMACLAKDIKVVALCSVFGNTSIENTTINTLRAAHAACADSIPVYPGASRSIAKHLSPARAEFIDEPVLHGEVEINGVRVGVNPEILPLEEAIREPEDIPAAIFYVDYLRNAEKKTTIVATGTLTNLAIALMIAPDIVNKIDEIVIMGGGVYKTNITASAEANFWKDPEAAKYVLGCGARISLITLDATHSAALTWEHEKMIRKIGTVPATFCANDIHVRIKSYNKYQPLSRCDTAPIHDALCIAYLLDPSVLTDIELCACDVDCSSGPSEGRLIVDMRYFTPEKKITVAFEADPDKFAALLVKVFSDQDSK